MTTSGLLARSGRPGAPVLPGGGGEGEGGVGEHLLEGGQGLDLLPDLLGPGLPGRRVGVPGPPDRDLPVLVDGELGEELGLPGEPHLVEQLGLGLGDLEAEVHPVLLEVVAAAAGVLPSDHPGGQRLPPAALCPVAHPEDVVASLGELVAGDDVGVRLDVGAGVALDPTAAHLCQGLQAAPPLLGLLLEVGGVDLEVPLHGALPRLVRLRRRLAGHLLQVEVLLLHQLQLLLQPTYHLLQLLGRLLHLAGDGVVHVLRHLHTWSLNLLLHLNQLGLVADEELLEEVEGDAVLPDQGLQAPGDLRDDADLGVDVSSLGLGLALSHLILLLLPLPEVDVQVGEALLEAVEGGVEGGGGGDLRKLPVEGPVPLIGRLLQLLPQVCFPLELKVVRNQVLDEVNN